MQKGSKIQGIMDQISEFKVSMYDLDGYNLVDNGNAIIFKTTLVCERSLTHSTSRFKLKIQIPRESFNKTELYIKDYWHQETT